MSDEIGEQHEQIEARASQIQNGEPDPLIREFLARNHPSIGPCCPWPREQEKRELVLPGKIGNSYVQQAKSDAPQQATPHYYQHKAMENYETVKAEHLRSAFKIGMCKVCENKICEVTGELCEEAEKYVKQDQGQQDPDEYSYSELYSKGVNPDNFSQGLWNTEVLDEPVKVEQMEKMIDLITGGIKLSKQEKRVVTCFLMNMSYQLIAEVLGINEENVKAIMCRARRKVENRYLLVKVRRGSEVERTSFLENTDSKQSKNGGWRDGTESKNQLDDRSEQETDSEIQDRIGSWNGTECVV